MYVKIKVTKDNNSAILYMNSIDKRLKVKVRN